ncbi:MAG: dihydroxyacetone kinase subunit DhaK, partial [Caldilineaceae bacterium]|nr:dihydroxyacetone kinase subunit DhaK [Caldilineaceae bacterium]
EQQLIGNYITSLEMAGCAVTLMRVDAELLELWNAPVHTPTLWW